MNIPAWSRRRWAISAQSIYLEPGRMIVGNAGNSRNARDLHRSRAPDRVFTIVDGAMNDLIRPTLYEAYHEIWPVVEARGRRATCDAGRVESRTAKPAIISPSSGSLPPFQTSDFSMAVMTAGRRTAR